MARIDIEGSRAMTDTLIQRLSDEADLCRNDGATDVAKLIDDAVYALVKQAAELSALRADAERTRADLMSCRGTVRTEYRHYERLSMVHGKTPHGECYWNEAQRLSGLLDRIDSLVAIDAALRQEQPT